jgi:hypothetical protein
MSGGVSLSCPVAPHDMSKALRFGMEQLCQRVVASAAGHGVGRDLILRVYLAGIYHGVELSKRDSNSGPTGRRREPAPAESPQSGRETASPETSPEPSPSNTPERE